MRWALLLPVGLVAAGAWCLTGVGARATEGKGAVVKLGNLKSRAPASWKQEKTSNRMRAFQFRVPGAEGARDAAELVIFFFGQGGAGTPADNVKRWKGMFEPPAGKTIDDVSRVKELQVGGRTATYADIEGTYLEKFPPFDPNAKVTRKPNYRRLGVILPTEDGPYFITLTGPARTVAQNQKGFDEWLKAFK